ncbi:MAG: 30S ribosomal protein S16 [Pirellulales bacterium]|nr:30S ribosomal protein S16 [Pirellulales bacterium]
MKKMGRAHRAFFRICATDKRAPRDGRVLEELGTYDPSVPETDARAVLNQQRVAYWLGVGAQPSEKVAVLIKKYGPGGTHLEQQQKAIEKLKGPKTVPPVGPAAPSKRKQAEEGAAAEAPAAEAPAEGGEG